MDRSLSLPVIFPSYLCSSVFATTRRSAIEHDLSMQLPRLCASYVCPRTRCSFRSVANVFRSCVIPEKTDEKLFRSKGSALQRAPWCAVVRERIQQGKLLENRIGDWMARIVPDRLLGARPELRRLDSLNRTGG